MKLSPADPHPALVMINPHLPGLKAVRQDGKSQAVDALEGRGGREGGPVPVGDPDRARGAGRRRRPRRRRPVRGPGVDHERARRPVAAPRRLRRRDRPAPGRGRRRADPLRRRPRRRRPPRGLAPRRPRGCGWRAGTEMASSSSGRAIASSRCCGRCPPKGACSRTSGGNTPVWRESPGSDLFLFRFPDGVSACRLAGTRVVRVKPVATHEALGNAGDAARGRAGDLGRQGRR